MSAAGKSYRWILRSTFIIGGASVINILIGLVRVKVAAVLLAPAGAGLIGLFVNLIATAANVTALAVGALLLWHEKGLLVYLLLTPVASVVVGYWHVARLPKVQARTTRLRELTQQWRTLARWGTAFMLAGLALGGGRNRAQR